MPEDIKTPTPEVVDDKTPPVDDKQPPVEDKKEDTTPDDKTDKPEEKEPIKEEEKKEPEKEPEKKDEKLDDKPEDKKDSEEVAGLKEQISQLQQQVEQAKAGNDSKVALVQANALLKVQKDLASEYESILNGIIDAKLQEIPENLRELVPANLTIKERMDWLTKAEKSGVFKTNANPDVEIGKPLNPNNVKPTTDTTKLSASTLMAMAYGNSQKGKGKK